MIPPRLVTPVVACFLTAACAGRPGPLPVPSPTEIPDLEARLAAEPRDPEVALVLASGYREAERGEEAMRVVEVALAASPDDAGLIVMSGLLHEDAGDFEEARRAYEGFLRDARGGPLRDEVSEHLEAVRRQELRADVRSALDRESELADTPPDPAAVGIFPFAYEGDDPEWAPLGPALAELLVTDLATTGRLQVLERVRVQALLDEMALSEAGLVEERTAARSGRLLGSGHVVQGRYRVGPEQHLAVDAAVVSVSTGGDRVTPVQDDDDLERLFDLEKRLALDLHAELNISLTPAERARIDMRETESVQALLAFGRGLMASDAGDFEEAERQFSEAASLDPSFVLAGTYRAKAARSVASRGASGELASRAATLAKRRRAVQALRQSPALRQKIFKGLSRKQRAVLAEVLGQDRVGTAILLELVFKRPGGTP